MELHLLQIVIADDHQIQLDGLAAIFDNYPNFHVVAHAHNGIELVSVLEVHEPDLVFLDLCMQDCDGLDALNTIKIRWPNLKTIILTQYNDPKLVETCMNRGAKAYLLKSTGEEELIKTIEQVMQGNTYIGLGVYEPSKHLNNIDYKDYSKYADDFLKKYSLTHRELDIFVRMAKGFSSKEIANNLHISPQTVSTHRKHIKQKLGVKNLAELIRFAFEQNFI